MDLRYSREFFLELLLDYLSSTPQKVTCISLYLEFDGTLNYSTTPIFKKN